MDDDPLVLQMYQDGLQQLGAEVTTASDGIDAIQALRGARPDVLVLDLMMPKFTGADVLKFVRSEPALKNLPVVVLSNSYMNQLAGEAVALGVEKALLKIRCSPSVLLDAINEAADGQPRNRDASVLLAVPAPTPTAPPTPAGQPEPPAAAPAPGASAAPLTAAEFDAKAREVLVRNARETCTTLRNLYQAYTSAPNPAEREQRLQTLTRKVHFVAATAGLAKCRRLGQVASALEALLFELQARPAGADPSVGRTIAGAVDFLALLFDYARDADPDAPSSSQALVVDDDPLSNRLVVSALNRA
ncbi:MAG TPA: response regulator, partial [Rhodocyclaceae bacterium]|nr:response regulator [Rhodocyclaceae bacterium]